MNQAARATANAVRNTLQPDNLPRLCIYAHIFGTEAVVNNRVTYLAALM